MLQPDLHSFTTCSKSCVGYKERNPANISQNTSRKPDITFNIFDVLSREKKLLTRINAQAKCIIRM